MDDRHIIHRVLEDNAGDFIFGYDLLVAANPTLKQFKIEVRPLDRQLKATPAEKTNGAEPARTDVCRNISKTCCAQMLDDGDAFSLDLLVNQNTGVKIVDVVRVTFDRSNLRDPSPRMMPRDSRSTRRTGNEGLPSAD